TAQTAVNSLFEDALRGWRTQAYLSGSGVVTGSLMPDGALRTFGEVHRARAEGHANAARALGGTLTAENIAELLDRLPPIRHRQALCHWDLHGENVRVRGGQAILIDFLNVKPGPLVVDPAALETSLALSCTAEAVDWRQVVTELYSIANLRTLPEVRPPTAPLNELWNTVRQIRRFGLAEQLSEDEYVRSVALHLLRHTLRQVDGEDPLRRPMMALLAERLARELVAVVAGGRMVAPE
ncbi:MAG: phosphotransferase, partial [Terriglobales bacterium]